MRRFLVAILFVLPCVMFGITRTVALDGSQQYNTIQTAIDACVSQDSVLVYPGRYVENIDMNHHTEITLASLYARNPVQAYMDSTIIDGNLDTCIKATNEEEFTVNGFTLVNNEQNALPMHSYGGGIYISGGSNLHLYNCIIRDCSAVWAGGGIDVSGGALYLSNVKIFHNRAEGSGGGLVLYGCYPLEFDTAHPSSIYDNTASSGMDIYAGFNEPFPVPLNIALARGSIVLEAADDYFIRAYNVTLNVSVQEAYLTQTDGDLYVSPAGNDANQGSSSACPLRTITAAMQKIVSDAVNPHSIYLTAGTYSRAGTGEELPLGCKAHTRICGAGRDSTLIDADGSWGIFDTWRCEDVQITGIGMMNLASMIFDPVNFYECSGVRLSDLSITNCQGEYSSGMDFSSCQGVTLTNIYVGDTLYNDSMPALYMGGCRDVIADGIVCAHTMMTGQDGYYTGFTFTDSDIILRNSILVDNYSMSGSILYYRCQSTSFQDCTLKMSNVLVVHNRMPNSSWGGVYIRNHFRPAQIYNCTIAGNVASYGFSTRIYGYGDIRNCIFYNPLCRYDIYVQNQVEDYQSNPINGEVSISNSSFSDSTIWCEMPELVTLTDLSLGNNPLFRGSVTGNPDLNDPMYYYLYSTSNCIDAGLADTTGMCLPETDYNGDPRIVGGRIDMGCYEFGSVSNDTSELPSGLADKMSLTIYPNPVYLSRTAGYNFIEFSLPEQVKQTPIVEIYNIKGQRVIRIASPDTEKGVHTVVWNGKDDKGNAVGSGMYLYKLTTSDHKSIVKKCMLMK